MASSSEFPFAKRTVEVEGATIAYVDEGSGQPVLFLHGNPTSSYLWRNIIPYVVAAGYRAVAPDLIGMGDSAKPDIEYRLQDHVAYMDGFIDALGLDDMVLVIHDWGSVIGMRHARLNPDRVAAVAFMEALVPPALPMPSYEAMGPQLGPLFRDLRTADVGEKMVLDGNFFVETILPEMGVVRSLSEAEMAAYRAPFPTRQSRLPTLQWPREVPIGGEPAFAEAEVLKNGEWLMASPIPKLLFHAEPGALAPKPVVDYLSENVPNLEVRFVGAGTHFLQEDHPHLIGQGIADWLRRNKPHASLEHHHHHH
uniref:DmmA Haloalkane Dehalogenase n=1 Tax=unidentified TaxID=32644 RepID=UPI0002438B3F